MFQDKRFVIKMVSGLDETLYPAWLTDASLRHPSVTAALAISNIVKSSLGPLGLDKMLVDNIGVRFPIGFHFSKSLNALYRKSLFQTTVLPFSDYSL